MCNDIKSVAGLNSVAVVKEQEELKAFNSGISLPELIRGRPIKKNCAYLLKPDMKY